MHTYVRMHYVLISPPIFFFAMQTRRNFLLVYFTREATQGSPLVTYMHTYMHTCMHAYIHAYIHTNMHA
jgi:hypothetical protein